MATRSGLIIVTHARFYHWGSDSLSALTQYRSTHIPPILALIRVTINLDWTFLRSLISSPTRSACCNGGDSVQSLLGKKFIAAKSGWLADAADFFVLLCSFLLTTASIVLVAQIFYAQANVVWDPVSSGTLSPESATFSSNSREAVYAAEE
ncbi:hypothetical protein EV363DRAFT_1397074 [Boletus edulis]|nr:hypothetical protein EV363DRAFT_1397074 [Boletus edulis]